MEDKLQVTTMEKVNELIELFPTRLRRGWVAITTNTTEFEDEDNLRTGLELLPTQYVIAVGDLVKDFKPGDKVEINVDALFTQKRYSNNSDESFAELNVKIKEVDNVELAIVDERIVEQIYK